MLGWRPTELFRERSAMDRTIEVETRDRIAIIRLNRAKQMN